mmetsp:Transcript_83817/g.240986  ORF Transcript_83817/g.240986 Transcript_83817/m.240986 type:complete len:291 (+) Transcript_83817:426-1298(+)
MESEGHALRGPENCHRVRIHGLRIHDVQLCRLVLRVVSVRQQEAGILSITDRCKYRLTSPSASEEVVSDVLTGFEVILHTAANGMEGHARAGEDSSPRVPVLLACERWVDDRKFDVQVVKLTFSCGTSLQIEDPLVEHGGLRLPILEGEALLRAPDQPDDFTLLPSVHDVKAVGTLRGEPTDVRSTFCMPRQDAKLRRQVHIVHIWHVPLRSPGHLEIQRELHENGEILRNRHVMHHDRLPAAGRDIEAPHQLARLVSHTISNYRVQEGIAEENELLGVRANFRVRGHIV